MMPKRLLTTLIISISAIVAAHAQNNFINPGEIWPDTDGQHIQAHGGGIVRFGRKYYWYGEQRRKGVEKDSVYRYVSCYSSRDLRNWKFEGDALKLARPDTLLRNDIPGQHWVLERPKTYYNKRTHEYVMYMHLDGTRQGTTGRYNYASVGVAVSRKPPGPFELIDIFKPLGKDSRDIGQFIDDDGTAYLIFECRSDRGFYIARLSEDYHRVEECTCFIKAGLEGGAIAHYNGLYYCIGSALTGWAPNPNKYATATSLEGPWSEFRDIAPPETKTWSSQSTMLLKVTGTKKTTVIFMGDQWRPSRQWDSRYIWMPVEIGDGHFSVPRPRPWRINPRTGEVEYQPAD